jgi:hypothetical protein
VGTACRLETDPKGSLAMKKMMVALPLVALLRR